MGKRNKLSILALLPILILSLALGTYARPGQAAEPTGPGAPQQAWHIEQVSANYYDSPSIALDSSGEPRIAFFGQYPDSGLRYARHQGLAWDIEQVDADYGDYASLALDALDNPHIAYQNQGSNLKYAHYYDGSWHFQIVDPSPQVGTYTSIAIDSAGLPHIAYWDYTNQAVKYARRAGANWTIETVDVITDTGWPAISMDLDSADYPHMIYNAGFPGETKYAYKDGTGWHLEVVGQYGGLSTSLVVDSQDRPHIAYTENQLMYAYRDGSGWHKTVVHDDHLAGENLSLTLDSAGRPRIAYSFWNYPDEGWLVYSYFDGFDWQRETVEVRPGADILGPISLAVDAADHPHIAYGDLYSDTLTYAVYREACVPLTGVNINGPTQLSLGTTGQYQAVPAPADASLPLSYSWDGGATGASVSYSWDTVGSYTVAVTATNLCSQVQDSQSVDVFCQAIQGVAIGGPSVLLAGQTGNYEMAVTPLDASLPLTVTWDNGASGTAATYSWPVSGTYSIAVTVTNPCGGVHGDTLPVNVLDEWPYSTYLPVVSRGE